MEGTIGFWAWCPDPGIGGETGDGGVERGDWQSHRQPRQRRERHGEQQDDRDQREELSHDAWADSTGNVRLSRPPTWR
jgi:hypothetical protein